MIIIGQVDEPAHDRPVVVLPTWMKIGVTLAAVGAVVVILIGTRTMPPRRS